MFKKLIFIGALLLQVTKTNAQPSTFQIMVGELRSLFSNVSNPNPQISFFYDLSPHFVDSAFFHHYVAADTNNASNWFALYKEMYYMAYDTTLYLKSEQVYQQALPKIQSDTIPVGIIDWNFNLLVPAALTTGNYFSFDTINSLLYDIPGGPNPYTVQTCFAGSTFRETYPFTNPVFIIDPDYFFKDTYKQYLNNESILKIDFGDGTGWHAFNESQVHHYQAFYGSGGRKTLRYGIFANASATLPMRYAVSAFFITTENPLIPPTIAETHPGIDVFYYGPDPDCQQNLNTKFVIYLEGFDPKNRRNPTQIYNDMIVDPQISQLKNFGYTFVIINWHDGNAPLQQNARHVVDFLEYLKCNNMVNRIPPQPFVMIGESMGGLIGRYALCYMESQSYSSTCSIDGVAHNVRLLITIVVPHQGANVPIGLQYLYKYGTSSALAAIGFSPWAIAQFSQDLLALNGAATEMLKYHVDTDPFLSIPVSSAQITEHPNKTNFDNALANLGDYPQFCKLVALSNGSWLGTHQPTAWDEGIPRQPNDFMLDITSETYLRILGTKILSNELNLIVNTNPAGTGRVFYSDLTVAHWKIKLKWFGVKLVWWTNYLFQIDKTVQNVEPYCVMPGSNNSIDGVVGLNNRFNSFNLLDFFGFQVVSGNGNLNVSSQMQHSFFGSPNVSFNAYSDGFDFGFIPTYSSFDYNNGNGFNLDHPILNEPIIDNLNETPFDVVYTNPTDSNWNHLEEQNPALSVCSTCLSTGDPIRSRLLNREIGDDSLWLENFPTNYASPIECERDMMVNERNIYYNYDSQPSLVSQFDINQYNQGDIPNLASIVISKEDPMGFNINQDLVSNDNIWQNPAQPPLYGTYQWNIGSMQICCINYGHEDADFRPTDVVVLTGVPSSSKGPPLL